MQKYIVTKMIEVEAESPEDAVAKSKDGKTISLAANPSRIASSDPDRPGRRPPGAPPQASPIPAQL